MYNFLQEPRDHEYRTLVEFTARISNFVVLVVRDEVQLSARGKELLDELNKNAAQVRRGDAWPGTQLHGRVATIFEFRLVPQVVHALAHEVRGLYEWCQPAMPEDLGFLREDRSELLGSISHEADAFANYSQAEYDELCARAPRIRQFLVPSN